MNSQAVSIAFTVVVAVAPFSSTIAETPVRWYEQSRVESGEKIYETSCASCHGARGEAIPHWRRPDSEGNFPPPPLNGTAHTWHHPFRVLAQQIKFGAPRGMGKMPAFKGILSDEDIIDVIAWIQKFMVRRDIRTMVEDSDRFLSLVRAKQ